MEHCESRSETDPHFSPSVFLTKSVITEPSKSKSSTETLKFDSAYDSTGGSLSCTSSEFSPQFVIGNTEAQKLSEGLDVTDLSL